MTLLISIVDTSHQVAATSARSAKTRALAACVRDMSADEVEIGVAYLTGETPQGRFGIGYATLRAAGEAHAAASATLTLLDVDARLADIAAIRGAGSAAKRAQALRDLFGLATQAEQEFLIRLLIGELRQGALSGVMVDAIAAAAKLPIDHVRRAAMYEKSLGRLAKIAFENGADGLAQFQLQLMSPIAPMLAQTAADVDEALETLSGEVVFEWKLDGARIQVHKRDDEVRIYTRSLNEITSSIPEIVATILTLPARELVLDGEAIALSASGRPHPFQTTMRRFGRKLDVEQLRRELPVQAFFFDCLRLDASSLAERPTRERFAALASVVPVSQLVPRLETRDAPAAQAFYGSAIAQGHEGIMAKSLAAPYEAGNRGASWLKIKRAHTLDLVVLAAEWGHGRRTGKLSNLHLGAFDPSTGEYVMLGKTFKGLTDAMLEWQTAEFLARVSRRDRYTVYVRPEIVVEIAFSDVQASPRYPGGLALRLARVKGYRPDKRVEEADTMETIRKIYAAQSAGTDASGEK